MQFQFTRLCLPIKKKKKKQAEMFMNANHYLSKGTYTLSHLNRLSM